MGLALRFVASLDLAADWCFAIGLGLVTDLDLAPGLRLAGAERGWATTTNRRRGFRLPPGAADLVLLADDARFMG